MTPVSCRRVAGPGSLLLWSAWKPSAEEDCVRWAHPLAVWEAERCRLWLILTSLTVVLQISMPVFGWHLSKRLSYSAPNPFFCLLCFPHIFILRLLIFNRYLLCLFLFHFFSSSSVAALQVSDSSDTLLREFSLFPFWNSSQESAWCDTMVYVTTDLGAMSCDWGKMMLWRTEQL